MVQGTANPEPPNVWQGAIYFSYLGLLFVVDDRKRTIFYKIGVA
jgi:hypothetical protein